MECPWKKLDALNVERELVDESIVLLLVFEALLILSVELPV